MLFFALMPVSKGCSCCRNNINTAICGYVTKLSSTTGTSRDCFKLCHCKSEHNVITLVWAAILHEEQTLHSVMILNATTVENVSCTWGRPQKHGVFCKTVNSLMLLKWLDVFCKRMLIHLIIQHKGSHVIEATDVTSLWCLGEGVGIWGAAAPPGHDSVNHTCFARRLEVKEE